jgi:adenylate kinase
MRIVMLGAPGSGKGTQAKRLQEEHGFVQISTGDLLRAAVAEGTDLGRRAQAVMDAGDLVSDDIVLGMLEERIARPDAARGFILDGFPRNLAQAESLDRLFERVGLALDRAVLMEVDFDILIKRLTGRRTCSKTGKLLNIYFSPQAELDACVEAGGELLQRTDDNEDTIRNRLEVYEQQTAPLIGFYRDKGLLEIVAADAAMDEVQARLRAVLGLD